MNAENKSGSARIDIPAGLDILITELPGRYVPFIPNNLGYLHLILQKTRAKFFIFDANIFFFHRYHSSPPNGGAGGEEAIVTAFKRDPWAQENSFCWHHPECLKIFIPWIEELIARIAEAKPAMVGFSVSETSRCLTQTACALLRKALPEVKIIMGGYDFFTPLDGPKIYPEADYMFINEAEVTLPLFIERTLRGEPCADMPGVISRRDSPGRVWEKAPLPMDLDAVGYPKYEWTDLELYRGPKVKTAIFPVSGSRGCRWSRCRFCGEWNEWRTRSADSIFDEIQWFYSRGFKIFHFNESDFNGSPELTAALCRKIIDSGMKPELTGQLRINKNCDFEFFSVLRRAGFNFIRFGVDAWSSDEIKLQRKGYTMEIAERILRDAKKAGITVSTNILIGLPGETERMIDDVIANIIRNRDSIDIVESINTLILCSGNCYYLHPEEFNIKFREDKDKLYAESRFFIRPEKWYCEEPYLDHNIQLERLKKLCRALYDAGIPMGSFAEKFVEFKTGAGQRSAGTPRLLEEMFYGINIIECGGRCFGLPARLGAFDLSRAGECIEAGSQEGVKSKILGMFAAAYGLDSFDAGGCAGMRITGATPELVRFFPPELVRAVDGYNIVKFIETYYAVPFGVPVDWSRDDLDRVPGMLRASGEARAVMMIKQKPCGGQ